MPLPTRVTSVPAADPRRNYMSPKSTTPAALVTRKRSLRCCALRIATHRLIKPSAATTTLRASCEPSLKPDHEILVHRATSSETPLKNASIYHQVTESDREWPTRPPKDPTTCPPACTQNHLATIGRRPGPGSCRGHEPFV